MRTPKSILTFLSIFLFSSIAFAQVVIKDTVVIAPRKILRSQGSPISNQQYYLLTISISCDALNVTHDPTFARGAVDVAVGDSSARLANALNPGDLGRTGVLVFTSNPIPIGASVQINIGGTICTETQDSPTSFIVILDSVTVASGIYQQTNPFPTVNVIYPLQQQNIYGITTLHGEAQVNPGPDTAATVTWTIFDYNGNQRTSQSSNFDISGFSDVVYVKATATNKYGSTDSDPVQIWIASMTIPPGNEIYPRESGTLTISINGVDTPFFDSTQGMVLTMNGNPLLNASVQTTQIHVGQWTTLRFQLWQKGWQHALGFNYQIVDSYGHVNFDETDFYTAYSFNFALSIDSTQQALPPDWVYAGPSGIEDPFLPCPTAFISPINGELLLQVTSVSTDAVDTLFLLSPVKKFLLFQPSGYLNDTVDCGAVNAGDTLQFYLHSDMSIDNDQNMYPEIILPDTGVMASRAARSGPAASIFPLKKAKPLPRMTAGGKLPQRRSNIEKADNPVNAKPISMEQFAGIQQKTVQIQATRHGRFNQLIASPTSIDPQTLLLFEDWVNLIYNKIVAVSWVEEKHTIMLGESKYYYVIQNGNQISIKDDGDPEKPPTDRKEAAIFGDPVATGSEKNPVYWEDQRPTYSGSTFTGSEKLPKGMIRLVGRYWEEGKTFKATLTASVDGNIASIDIETTKPAKLIDWQVVKGLPDFKNGNDYSQTTDVYGNPLNVDSMIISIAGTSGIPPQYIKGQMYGESYLAGGHFEPTYRYEPGEDFSFQLNRWSYERYFRNSYPFVVKLTPPNMGGTLPTPAEHKNVQPVDYQGIRRQSITIFMIGAINTSIAKITNL